MIRTSMCSVTFRRMKPEEIIRLAVQAGLDAIEWGGDIHVPCTQQENARRVYQETKQNGLQVSAYGSYYIAGAENSADLRKRILDTAEILFTDTVRVWAGNLASSAETEDSRKKIEDDLAEMVRLASERKIRIATEFHENTLTDTINSALRMLKKVHGLYSLWQPTEGWSFEQCLDALNRLGNRFVNYHVYKLDDNRNRLPLSCGAEEWRRWFAVSDCVEQLRYATLEFVAGDEPSQFLADAETLKKILKRMEDEK